MPLYKKLIKKLSKLCPTIEDSKLMLRYAGIETDGIAFNAAARVNWMNIVEYAENKGKLNVLIQTLVDEYEDDELLEYIKEETAIVPLKDASNVYKEEFTVDKDELKKAAAFGKLKEVLTKLELIADEYNLGTDYKNSIYMMMGQLNGLLSDRANGILRQEDYNIGNNKIRNSINYLIDQIDQEREISDMLSGLSGKNAVFTEKTGLNVPEKSEFEKVMRGRDTIVAIDWLSKALDQSKLVCKIELSSGGSGTGFILKGGYVLTNHHVICKHFPQHVARCNFECKDNHECPLRGRVLRDYQSGADSIIYELDPADTFIINKELDYALIKLKDNAQHPLAEWGSVEFETFRTPAIDDLVNIIQHPEGEQKKIAMPDTVISIWPENNYIFYLADTKGGSSGSPVFNQDWKVVALHHAGRDEADGGLTINAAGDTHEANRGILIKAILDDIKAQGVNL